MNCQYGGRGGTLLHRAVTEGDRKAVQLLLAAGASADMQDGRGRTALHIACQGGQKVGRQRTVTVIYLADLKEIFDLLMATNPQVVATDTKGDQPSHVAAGAGHLGLLESLLSRGAELAARGHQGNSLLHCAAATAQAPVVRFCLERGIKPDITNSLTETPLHKAHPSPSPLPH